MTEDRAAYGAGKKKETQELKDGDNLLEALKCGQHGAWKLMKAGVQPPYVIETIYGKFSLSPKKPPKVPKKIMDQFKRFINE